MAAIVKTVWFGRQLNVLLVTGKSVSGELTEVTDAYIVLDRDGTEVQVMAHAIAMIVPAATKDDQAQAGAGSSSGPELFE